MLATANPSPLPFKVILFENKRTGSRSWRVTGSGAKNGRRRINYSETRGGESAARAECDRLNADELRAVAQMPPMRAMPTRLDESEILVVEAAKERAAGRWELSEIIDAGLNVMEHSPKRVEIAPLFAEWKAGPAEELQERWRKEVEGTCGRFLDAHPGLMSTDWTIATTRRWLDGLNIKGQTKANYRNGLHRFAGWLVERGMLKDNPASGLWITRAKERAGLPVVYSVLQCEAMLEVCQKDSVCRPLLGWLALTLFCGLRPESEAPFLLWTQVRKREREIILRGNKRGSKARIVKLQPAAFEFLRLVQDETVEGPGCCYTRGIVRRLERLTDELLRAKGRPLLPEGSDINRHTYASMRAAMGVQLHALAKEMGNDTETLYGHYIQPIADRDAKKFWALRPLA